MVKLGDAHSLHQERASRCERAESNRNGGNQVYDLAEVRELHLEITSRCQARCPMCPRRNHGGDLLEGLTPTSMTLDEVRCWFPPELVRQLTYVLLCGNLGDPIVAPDCLPIVQYLRETNRGLAVGVHTNGSARPVDWWRQLAETGARVLFGIDGLEDTHRRYRRGTQWLTIIRNAQAFINAGGVAEWHMLVFGHNEHQVDACRKLAAELGFQTFVAKDTTRFSGPVHEVWDQQGNVIDMLHPSSRTATLLPTVVEQIRGLERGISCQVAPAGQVFVAADGTVAPCCYLDLSWYPSTTPDRMDYDHKIAQYPNLHEHSFAEILESGYFSRISLGWQSDPLRVCSIQCGGGFTRRASEYRDKPPEVQTDATEN